MRSQKISFSRKVPSRDVSDHHHRSCASSGQGGFGRALQSGRALYDSKKEWREMTHINGLNTWWIAVVQTRSLKTLLITGRGPVIVFQQIWFYWLRVKYACANDFPATKMSSKIRLQHFPQIGALHLPPKATQQISFPPTEKI